MRATPWLLATLLPLLAAPAFAAGHAPPCRLAGTLVDHTDNHGADRRIWSPVLGECRSLYVYLPPGFDPRQSYPVLLWLHGLGQDERALVEDGLCCFDAAMAAGRLPPTIIAIPDGSLRGQPKLLQPQTLWLNSKLGPYEDYLVRDVWGFVLSHYPVRPEREAHVIGGFSGGGAAAYRVAIKYRDEFAVVFALDGPLNTRWTDCHGHYFGNFDPCCWGWRTDLRARAPVGRFYGGLVTIRISQLVYPLFGRGPESLQQLIENNPIEMLDQYDVRPGELAMFVGYGCRDEYNLDAQSQSFIYHARQRGLAVATACDPWGRHRQRDAVRLLPDLFSWLAPLLAPYAPPPVAGE